MILNFLILGAQQMALFYVYKVTIFLETSQQFFLFLLFTVKEGNKMTS